MSALAVYALSIGAVVSGSDRERTVLTDRLSQNCNIFIGENPDLVQGCDMVVYTSAISELNTELMRARELDIPTFERREFLALVANRFEKTVAIAGTHGKTTVTAMITHALKNLNADFSAHIGGETEFGNWVSNGNEIFVTEACEYKKSLLTLSPYISVVLNCECDHPDCYKDEKSLATVFGEFLNKGQIQVLSKEVFDICQNAHISISGYENILKDEKNEEKINMLSQCDGKDVLVFSNGTMKILSPMNLGIPYGKLKDEGIAKLKESVLKWDMDTCQNPENTFAVFAVLDVFGYERGEIADSLKNFKGVKRRGEVVGYLNGAKVVFDYAHHPTQISNTLSMHKGKNLVIFQPHTYSRTAAYLDGFCKSLAESDTLVIMETYGARESESAGIDSSVLCGQILTKFPKTDVKHIVSHRQTIEFVISAENNYDNILFLGAGDIYNLKDEILPYLNKTKQG